MSVEVLDSEFEGNNSVNDDDFFSPQAPLNGTDARRRLENRIEDIRLRKELQEFDFDL